MRPGIGGVPPPPHPLPPSPAAAAEAHSPWRSPVPYLFGGLAAMLSLIAFALLILACSYWKLSAHLDPDSDDPRRGGGGAASSSSGGKGSGGGPTEPPPAFEERIAVIMAGNQNPTHLATPTFRGAVTAPPRDGTREGEANE
ncbi:protein GLUTAMINE DUMPER 5-like [Ananas comosus]|uniref:Protein GLUTAMINE DUMPER 5-like n=1 Tax=Ananas comosus TaxID=4615 RepID=A0A6P5GVP0_ANACO|nr:protein GLUTAMINE DUMPER 5-like [Ananas comosus]